MRDEQELRGRPLILLADEDPAIRKPFRSTLEQHGFRVAEAADGRKAINVFSAQRPDAGILGASLSGPDGFEVCAAIRRLPHGAHTPILMLTGGEDTASVGRAYDAGATDCATKPANWLVLAHRVRHMLQAKKAADELQRTQAELAATQRIAQLGTWEWDPDTDCLHCSDEVFRFLSAERRSLGRLHQFLAYVHPDDRDAVARSLDVGREQGRPLSVNHRVVLRDGAERFANLQIDAAPGAGRQPRRVTGTIQDITERTRNEQQIRFLAHYDGLTILPNRVLFQERLESALQVARRKNLAMAVLFVDLDQFKRVNDTLGHGFGDRLLQAVAERLKQLVRATDFLARPDPGPSDMTVARLGGDEFILLLTEITRGEDAARVARRVLDSIGEPFRLDEREVFISASIGISLFPLDATDAESLLKQADTAMYYAKDSGRSNYQFYNSSMNAKAFERLALETGLRRALERREFVLYYQPQVDVEQGRIIGVEALIRWQHPDIGMVLPEEFIPLAEDTGLIIPIGEWVLKTACAQARIWAEAGHDQLRLAINLSAHHFEQPAANLRDIISSAGCDPRWLELEITESALMGDSDRAKSTLQELKALGIRISIDDFGTGYSSLGYLKRFCIDALKIDRSFVHDLGRSEDDAAITSAILSMARSLHVDAVAEGVETEEQRDFLRMQGCRLMQGYLFGRPVPGSEITALLEQQKARQVEPAPVV